AEKVDFPAAVAAVQTAFGKQCVPFNLPDAVGPSFKGVLSVLDPAAKAPPTCPMDPAAVRSQLVDAVVESDESLTEKFLTEGEVSPQELEAAIPKAIAAGTLVPIFCTSAKKDVGVKE